MVILSGAQCRYPKGSQRGQFRLNSLALYKITASPKWLTYTPEKTRPLIYCLQTHHPQLTVLKGCPRSAKQIMTLSMLSTTLRLNGSSRPRVRSFYTNERTWTVYMTIWRASGIRSFHLTILACQLMTCGSVSSRRFSRLLKGLFHDQK